MRMVLDAVSGNSGAIPDVILMDIQMPVMDGYTAAERIRAIQGQPGQEIPIVALTADAFASDITHARRSGMNAFIAKPIDLGILKEVLQNGPVDTWVFSGPRPFMAPALKAVFPGVFPEEKRISVLSEKLEEVAVFED